MPVLSPRRNAYEPLGTKQHLIQHACVHPVSLITSSSQFILEVEPEGVDESAGTGAVLVSDCLCIAS
eukprot:4226276-Pyramimonas_sp.AAC.1